MSEERLTPELQSLLAGERDAGGPDAGVRNRVSRRLAQTLGVTLAAAGASSAATSGAQTVLPKALVGKSLAAKLLIAALVGGVGVGGVVTTVKLMQYRHAAKSAPAPLVAPAPSPPVVAPPAVAPPAVAAPAVLPPPTIAAPSLAAPAPSPPTELPRPAHAAPPHHAAHHADLAAERALLTDARAAVQASDATRALALLDNHARRFAHGQLAEERDALRVGALWLAGDHDAARRHADEFARRHPDSLFLPSVQRAVAQ